jgi:hypothetical protein
MIVDNERLGIGIEEGTSELLQTIRLCPLSTRLKLSKDEAEWAVGCHMTILMQFPGYRSDQPNTHLATEVVHVETQEEGDCITIMILMGV